MTERAQEQYDIVIVGGGLVGASLACLLEPLPLTVALVDRVHFDPANTPFRAADLTFDARVSAITRASQALLDELGLWERIEGMRSCAYTDMHVWDADGTGNIHFNAGEIHQPQLGHIVENSLLSTALYERLAHSRTVKLRNPLSITAMHRDPDTKQMHLQTDQGTGFVTQLVIAADGGQSPLREMAGFATREWDYDHQALVTTVRTELPHRRCALQRFMSTGPLAFLPLSTGTDADEHYSSIVWSMQPELASEIMGLEDADFRRRLGGAIENRLGAIEWSDRRFAFPLRQRHATEYVQEGIALVGDAAHTIHPLAGQGVNLGLLDVKVLAEELRRGIAAGRKPSDLTVLRRYQRRRKGHNLSMMWMMEGFKHLFAEEALPVRWLRNVGMSGVDSLPLVKNELARHAMGLNW